MKVWLNDLFTVTTYSVKRDKDLRKYVLRTTYPVGTVDEIIRPKRWMDSPDQLKRLGLSMLVDYLDEHDLYIMYALAISRNGTCELKWYKEASQRNSLVTSANQLHRPSSLPIYAARGFDFVAPRDADPRIVECEMIKAYHRLCRKLLRSFKLKPGP